MNFNKEIEKIYDYNEEVKEFFLKGLLNGISIEKKLNQLGFARINERLTDSDYLILKQNFPRTMAILQNGCKPGYFPEWVKINDCLARKAACNLHDFLYWISWPRKASDKIFLKEMNKHCKGFKNELENYFFYLMVRTFGNTAFNQEEKTIQDFLCWNLVSCK